MIIIGLFKKDVASKVKLIDVDADHLDNLDENEGLSPQPMKTVLQVYGSSQNAIDGAIKELESSAKDLVTETLLQDATMQAMISALSDDQVSSIVMFSKCYLLVLH